MRILENTRHLSGAEVLDLAGWDYNLDVAGSLLRLTVPLEGLSPEQVKALGDISPWVHELELADGRRGVVQTVRYGLESIEVVAEVGGWERLEGAQ